MPAGRYATPWCAAAGRRQPRTADTLPPVPPPTRRWPAGRWHGRLQGAIEVHWRLLRRCWPGRGEVKLMGPAWQRSCWRASAIWTATAGPPYSCVPGRRGGGGRAGGAGGELRPLPFLTRDCWPGSIASRLRWSHRRAHRRRPASVLLSLYWTDQTTDRSVVWISSECCFKIVWWEPGRSHAHATPTLLF